MTTPAPKLRPAHNADTAAIREIVHAGLLEFGLAPDHRDTDIEDLEKKYWQPGGMFAVLLNEVDENPEIIGTVGLLVLPDQPRVGELRKMYLLPNWHRQGLGRILLEYALQQAAELGFKRLELETATVMTRAIALYRHAGFREIERPGKLNDRCELTLALNL